MRTIAFIDVAGQRAFDELQTVFVPAGGAVPAGPYAFLERYCVDPDCDCQRVIISAVGYGAPQTVLATLSYEWERAGSDHRFAIVTLEPSARQTSHSPVILELFRKVASADPAYVERLRRHYAEARAPRGAASATDEPRDRKPAAGGGAFDAERVKRQFPKEGFLLLVDADGLEVRVIDYHARPLVLPWDEIERLRSQAAPGSVPQAG
ncbi:MAG TPA: hypothetical protein VFF36_11035 [Planctomycetota bacterium]|nr:hypothetical protein [Planctomycetota bacterium]